MLNPTFHPLPAALSLDPLHDIPSEQESPIISPEVVNMMGDGIIAPYTLRRDDAELQRFRANHQRLTFVILGRWVRNRRDLPAVTLPTIHVAVQLEREKTDGASIGHSHSGLANYCH